MSFSEDSSTLGKVSEKEGKAATKWMRRPDAPKVAPGVAGVPFTLDHFMRWAGRLVLDNGEPWTVEPWLHSFLEDVFGGVPAIWLIVPEANTKTTSTAGLALYHSEFTEEGWVPVGASSRQQAEILFRQAEGFCLRSPVLAVSETFKCQEGYRRIRCDRMRSRIQIFAADDATADGIIPTLAIVEELHRHKNLKLYDTWRGKYQKRLGQTVVISTAGEPGSEFELRREQIRARSTDITRDGSYGRFASEGMVLHEFALQEGEDPEDLEAVKRCNPFSGITVETLRAKRDSPDFSMQHWRRFTCNLPTRSDVAAIQEKEWFDAKTGEEIPEGEPVWAGLDLGWKYDTTALVPLWVRDSAPSVCGPGMRTHTPAGRKFPRRPKSPGCPSRSPQPKPDPRAGDGHHGRPRNRRVRRNRARLPSRATVAADPREGRGVQTLHRRPARRQAEAFRRPGANHPRPQRARSSVARRRCVFRPSRNFEEGS